MTTIYALMREGQRLRLQPFDDDPPTLAPEKGLQWVPYVEPSPSPEQIEADRVAGIDAQIASLERAVLMPRVVREDLIMRFLQAASAAGITEAQLLDPGHPAYSPGYVKMHGFDAQIRALRAQR